MITSGCDVETLHSSRMYWFDFANNNRLFCNYCQQSDTILFATLNFTALITTIK